MIKGNGDYRIVGDPTEASLLTAAAKANIWKETLEKDFTFEDEIPFDSERKKMTIVRKDREKLIAYVKGAPDVLLEDCTFIKENGTTRKITAEDKTKILAVNDKFASEAMRVLAFAYRQLPTQLTKYEPKTVETQLTFTGLAAMIDPPRQEVKQAIMQCQKSGIHTVMITGDHKNTAVAIAKQLGFFEEDSVALTGEELDGLGDDDLFNRIEKIPVYARVSPEHKLRIVRAGEERPHSSYDRRWR